MERTLWSSFFSILLCLLSLHDNVNSYHIHPFTRFSNLIISTSKERRQQHERVVFEDKGNSLTQINCVDRDFVPIEPPIYQQSDWWISKANPNISKVYQKWPFAKPDLITFDVVGTLIQPSQSIGKWLRACIHEAGGYQYRFPQPQLFRKHFNETHRLM